MVKDILVHYKTDGDQTIYLEEFKDFVMGHKDYTLMDVYFAKSDEIKELEYKRKIDLFSKRYDDFIDFVVENLKYQQDQEKVINHFGELFGKCRK